MLVYFPFMCTSLQIYCQPWTVFSTDHVPILGTGNVVNLPFIGLALRCADSDSALLQALFNFRISRTLHGAVDLTIKQYFIWNVGVTARYNPSYVSIIRSQRPWGREGFLLRISRIPSIRRFCSCSHYQFAYMAKVITQYEILPAKWPSKTKLIRYLKLLHTYCMLMLVLLKISANMWRNLRGKKPLQISMQQIINFLREIKFSYRE